MSYGRRVKLNQESVISNITKCEPKPLIFVPDSFPTRSFRLYFMNIRAVHAHEGPQIAQISRETRLAAMPYLPDLHTPEEDLAFFASEIKSSTCLVAEVNGEIVGFGCVRDGWLNHLYVLPNHQGVGIGSALLNELRSKIDQFWVFQKNHLARDFYKLRGFIEVEFTDGAGNEENEPDVRFEPKSTQASST